MDLKTTSIKKIADYIATNVDESNITVLYNDDINGDAVRIELSYDGFWMAELAWDDESGAELNCNSTFELAKEIRKCLGVTA